MYLSKNSSIEDIFDYIENFPYNFLYYYSDKSWAQLYIDESAKGTAKKYPELFLEVWADYFPQYINTALFALRGENGSR